MSPALPPWPRIAWSPPPKGHAGPLVLGLNPWIHDFAAYNVWLRPLGLLSCLGMLRNAGASVALLDCLDRTWRDTAWPTPRKDGSGRFPKAPLDTPAPLAHVPRAWSRYGLDRDAAAEALRRLDPPPDLVLVASLMTYWYPGALETIRLARDLWPKVPVALGGIYATLCREHALGQSGADLVISGPLEDAGNWRALWALLGQDTPNEPADPVTPPALDLYAAPAHAPVIGSRGCPFACAYCASRILQGSFVQRDFSQVWADVEPELERGVNNLVFFDDALLLKPQTWLIPLLERLAAHPAPVALHTPNAMHLKALSPGICRLLRRAGLRTVRLGLETANFSQRPDSKATQEDWRQGVNNLFNAGFSPKDIGAYVLFGLPDQDPGDVEATIAAVRAAGLRPHLAHYSPIPGSELFARAREVSSYPLAEEPLYQNNSLWPCVPGGFSWQRNKQWKALVKGTACA